MITAFVTTDGTPCITTDDEKFYTFIGDIWLKVDFPVYSKSEQLRHDSLIDQLENEDREEEL